MLGLVAGLFRHIHLVQSLSIFAGSLGWIEHVAFFLQGYMNVSGLFTDFTVSPVSNLSVWSTSFQSPE